MKEFERSGEYSLVAVTEWYLQRAFSSVETIASLLRVRHLGATFSDSITLDGPKGGGIGFRNAEVVTYPLSGRTLADGVGDEALRRICPNLEGAVALWKVVARDERHGSFSEIVEDLLTCTHPGHACLPAFSHRRQKLIRGSGDRTVVELCQTVGSLPVVAFRCRLGQP